MISNIDTYTVSSHRDKEVSVKAITRIMRILEMEASKPQPYSHLVVATAAPVNQNGEVLSGQHIAFPLPIATDDPQELRTKMLSPETRTAFIEEFNKAKTAPHIVEDMRTNSDIYDYALTGVTFAQGIKNFDSEIWNDEEKRVVLDNACAVVFRMSGNLTGSFHIAKNDKGEVRQEVLYLLTNIDVRPEAKPIVVPDLDHNVEGLKNADDEYTVASIDNYLLLFLFENYLTMSDEEAKRFEQVLVSQI